MAGAQPNRVLGGDGQKPSTVQDCADDYAGAQTAREQRVARAYGFPVLDDDTEWQPPSS